MKTILILLSFGMLHIPFDCGPKNNKDERCRLIPNRGPCLAYMPKYYYDKSSRSCKEFIYGGCGGVVPFETLQECKQGCGCK